MINLNEIEYNKPIISRELILKNVNDFEIYEKYIDTKFEINKPFNSPFRKDNIPSFGIFKNSQGELIYNDFILGGGDVFAFVKYLFNYKSWWDVYSRIGIDFWLDKSYRCKKQQSIMDNRTKRTICDEPETHQRTIDLSVTTREWNSDDRKFWSQYGIRLATLKRYNVYPITHIFFKNLNKQKVIKADKLAYAFIEYKDGITTYKIYQPYSKYKWMNNNDSSVWQGWEQLPEHDDILIITKSLKDVMAIYDSVQIPAVSLQNEKIEPKINIVNELKRRFKKIYLLYDNDFDKETNWGRQFGHKIANEFDIKFIEIPDSFKAKDYSDLIKKEGTDVATLLLSQLLYPKSKVLEPDDTVPF